MLALIVDTVKVDVTVTEFVLSVDPDRVLYVIADADNDPSETTLFAVNVPLNIVEYTTS